MLYSSSMNPYSGRSTDTAQLSSAEPFVTVKHSSLRIVFTETVSEVVRCDTSSSGSLDFALTV